MAHTFDTGLRIPSINTSGTTQASITGSYTCGIGTTLLTVGLVHASSTDRAGGAPTYGGQALTQAGINRSAPSSPECEAELWYHLNPPTGQSLLLIVPNTGALLTKISAASFKAQAGYTSILDTTAGSGSVSANPSIRLITTGNGDVIVGIVADGATTWNPSSQSGTVLWNGDLGSWGGGSQYILQTTAGIVFSAWTQGSDDWGSVAAAFKEQSSGPVNWTGTVSDAGLGTDRTSELASMSLFDTSNVNDNFREMTTSFILHFPALADGTPDLSDTTHTISPISSNGILLSNDGQFGSCILVTGSSTFLTYPSSVLPATKGTISCWFRGTTTTTRDLFDSGGEGTAFLLRANTSNQLVFRNRTSSVLTSPAGTISSGTFGHVIFTFDFDADDYNLYYNNSLVGSSAAVQTAPSYSSIFSVGMGITGSNQLRGHLDDFIILDHVASEQERRDMFNGTYLSALSISSYLSIPDDSIGSEIISALEEGHVEINAQVTGSENDARETDAGTSFTYVTPTLLANANAVAAIRWNSGVRFTGVNIPAGSVIVHSYLTVTPGNTLVDDPNVDIYGELVPDTVDFSVSGTVTNRARTISTVQWTATGIGTAPTDSPNLATIIQEIINQPGYAGNLVMFLDGRSDSSAQLGLYSYDGSPANAVKLHVGYITASTVKTIQDLASGLDAVSLAALLSQIENVTGIDSSTIAALLGLTDAVLGGDFLDLSATLSISETGLSSDNPSQLLASLSLPETSSANDLLQLLASLSLSDVGSGSDNISILQAVLKIIADSGLGSDTVSISVNLSVQDVGTGTDALVIQVSLTVNDTGTGLDAETITKVAIILKSLADLASGSDNLSISASLSVPEYVLGIDSPAIQAALSIADSTIVSDSQNISASLSITDTSSATDILSILQAILKSIQDSASGLDVISSISASLSVAETGLGTDQLGQLLASLLVTDFGEGVEVVIHYDMTTQVIGMKFSITKSKIDFNIKKGAISFELD